MNAHITVNCTVQVFEFGLDKPFKTKSVLLTHRGAEFAGGKFFNERWQPYRCYFQSIPKLQKIEEPEPVDLLSFP